jgi:hypothetical protein
MHNSALPHAVAYSVADRLLDRPARDWVAEYKALESRLGPPALGSPAAGLEPPAVTSAGEYDHAVYGRARLSVEKGQLVFSYGTLSGAIAGTAVTWFRSDMTAVLGPSRLSVTAGGSALVLETAGERVEFTRLR